MKKFIKDYINKDEKFEKWQIIGIMALIIVISGIFGWIYEFIFYYFNGGMKEFYWQGGNFLPWINIYAIGAVIIVLTTYKLRKNPFIVFILSVFSTGLLEYFSGYIIYKLFDGLRYWDYNTEILNFGNINGFICFRSVFFFGLSALLLIYAILPFCIYLSKKMKKKNFLILSITLCSIILFDEFYNLILAKLFDLPTAGKVYKSMGFHFM